MMNTAFFDIRTFEDKESALRAAVAGHLPDVTYDRDVGELRGIPGSPIAYSVSEEIARIFRETPKWSDFGRSAHQGLATADNFRFVRSWWEVSLQSEYWRPLSKGSNRVPFYCELALVMNWRGDGAEMKSWAGTLYNNSHWSRIMMNYPLYLRPGLTYSRRPHLRGWFQLLPPGVIFSTDSPIIVGRPLELLKADAAILNSSIFSSLLGLLMARGTSGGQTLKYETGYVSSVPVPAFSEELARTLGSLVTRGFRVACALEAFDECSRYFRLPASLQDPESDSPERADLDRILGEIDRIAIELYGLSDADVVSLTGRPGSALRTEETEDEGLDGELEDDEEVESPLDLTNSLLSWAVGVAFGRFDWRLATGERAIPTDPEPFDPLPEKSPGMLPDGAEPFHRHSAILVDDPGHPHDLAHLMEEVLAHVGAPVTEDLRRWLRRGFFAFHLASYSKSRRKAPVYWPLSTASGGYTLWLYYPGLTSQTLYTAVNDLLEPKLKEIEQEAAALRARGTERTREEDRRLEALLDFGREVQDLRDELLRIAPKWQPNHDDGVQITAAPLWSLFRHKPWSKVLKETWAKLEKGDYDWAHLAMAYWPDRVRVKCRTDKSLAIAHGLDDLYEEPAPAKTKGRRKKDEDA